MEDELFAKGVAIREEMFGAEHGQAKIDRATDFTRDFEDLVTRYCFGDIWGREQLPRKTRSMITLAMLVAMGRTWEVKVHTQGAIANGVTKEEIREIMLHSAVYCGIPAANDGFQNAAEVLDSLGVE
jgi:4-carboxymuconolactone decarboxylase